jgi:hypothetical protein
LSLHCSGEQQTMKSTPEGITAHGGAQLDRSCSHKEVEASSATHVVVRTVSAKVLNSSEDARADRYM